MPDRQLLRGHDQRQEGTGHDATFTGTSTDIINMTGINFDCDITVVGTMRFEGP